MQTKLVNNHDSMRLDVYADGDKKTFVRFTLGRTRTGMTMQGNVGLQNAVVQMLFKQYDAFLQAKGKGNNGEKFAEIQKRCEAAENFKQVALIFAKETA